jgi:bacterioferritin (cytochrome b1)
MPIISKVPEIVKREFALEDYVLLAVEKYATFIESTPDHVVNSALKMIVLKDKEFAQWRKQQNTDSKSPILPKAGPKP